MSLTKFITGRVVKTPKPEEFERIMFVGPHPDDIEIGAGATAAKLAAMGKTIRFVICTDGRYGNEFAPAGTTEEQLIEIRKNEAIASAKFLGIDDVQFIGLSDGGFYPFEELLLGLAAQIGEFKPDIIFCTDPDVISECHIDHRNVGNACRQLAFFAPFEDIMKKYGATRASVQAIAFYMTAKPNRFVKTGQYFARQLEAVLTKFPSQYPASNPAGASVKLYLTLRAREYGLKHFCRNAEGFRVLGTAQMHCLPEAGE